jgi:NAD(P)H-flavin reductase
MSGSQAASRYRGEVTEISRLTPRVVGLRILVPDDFQWSPGQYVGLAATEDATQVGYFSIASAPGERPESSIELAVADSASLVSAGLSLGAAVWIEPPAGKLPFRRLAAASEIVLIGMGTGIAPLRSVLRALRLLQSASAGAGGCVGPAVRRVFLVQGARSEAECPFFTELSLEVSDEFVYWPVFSGPGESWAGRRGRVQDYLAELPLARAEICVCGSSAMVTEVAAGLAALGVDGSQIYSEGY